MTITHVQLFSVPVSDQDRARDFYVDTLGFDLVSDVQMSPDMRWMLVSPPGSQTAITLVTWFDTMPPGSTKGIVLETDDLDGEIERLRTHGLTISAPERAPWGTFVTFDDPDGNGIVLQATNL
ncbi:VOC family protein [Subtercola lobariae]|nr:VOC family protein [Subtercola lobariae]